MNEIDYDKLAEAIVKAQKAASENSRTSSRFRTLVLKVFNFIIYAFLVLLCAGGVYFLLNRVIPEGYVSPVVGILLVIALAVLILFSLLCQIESLFDDNDQSRANFSINISLIALLVSLTSLLVRIFG